MPPRWEKQCSSKCPEDSAVLFGRNSGVNGNVGSWSADSSTSDEATAHWNNCKKYVFHTCCWRWQAGWRPVSLSICFAVYSDWVEFFLSFDLNSDYVNVKGRAQSLCGCVGEHLNGLRFAFLIFNCRKKCFSFSFRDSHTAWNLLAAHLGCQPHRLPDTDCARTSGGGEKCFVFLWGVF